MYLLYGLLISFSPCVLPMLPIVLRMCHSFKGVMSYLTGNMVSYCLLGIMLSTAGIYFQNVMHTPLVLGMFSLALLYLAFVSFEIVRLPQFYFHTSNTFLMGITAPIIVSPCITPALGAIITMMLTKRCELCGLVDLILFGLGVNLPLVILSLGLNKIINNPKIKRVSKWINYINGCLLIGLIVYLWS